MTERLLLRGGRLFDGTEFREVGDVLVEDGLISRIGAHVPEGDARVLDCSGATVMPGLVDAHVHLAWAGLEPPPSSTAESTTRALRNARELVLAGVTTIRDTGGPLDVLRAVRQGGSLGPDMRLSGEILCAPGGHGTEIPLAVPIARECCGASEFATAVHELLHSGADLVKVSLNGADGTLQLTDGELASVVGTAHAAGARVAAHASVAAAVVQAVAQGVDTVEHGNGLDAATAAVMAAAGLTLVPTVAIFEEIRKQLSDDRHSLPEDLVAQHRCAVEHRLTDHRGALAAARAAGVRVALGTDRVPGGNVVAVHAEATALQRHGFSAAEVLRAATTGSCAALGITDRGVLAPGCRADVVAFAGNLETDLTGLATPRLVVQAGVVLLPDLTSS